MMNPTEYDSKALEAWLSNKDNFEQLQEQLDEYLRRYDSLFRTKPQRTLFQAFIRGLLSPLERKSIEPIALHFLGEGSVRTRLCTQGNKGDQVSESF